MCLESLIGTLLTLTSIGEDDVWRWQSPLEERGSALVPNNGVGGHVAHRTWRGDSPLTLFQYSASCPKRIYGETRITFVLTLD